MNSDSLPLKTVHDLATLFVLVAEVAWKGTRRTMRRFRPYFEPPPDLQVHSTRGARYTGVILIDGNVVLSGIVIRTGQSEGSPSQLGLEATPHALVTAPPREEPAHDNTYLRGWADDPREEEDAWYPRTQR